MFSFRANSSSLPEIIPTSFLHMLEMLTDHSECQRGDLRRDP
jgi:hypothetical protein